MIAYQGAVITKAAKTPKLDEILPPELPDVAKPKRRMTTAEIDATMRQWAFATAHLRKPAKTSARAGR